MNKLHACLVCLLAAGLLSALPRSAARAAQSSGETAPADFEMSDLSLRGEIEGENVVFTLAFKADVKSRSCRLPLVAGQIAFREGEFPRGAAPAYDGNGFVLESCPRGRQSVKFVFVGRPVKEGDWRRAEFTLPPSAVREAAVQCDRDDLEVDFPGALSVSRGKTPEGKTAASAFIGVGESFVIRWKPEIKKLETEKSVECEVNAIAAAGVGALHLDTMLDYRVVQGALRKLAIAVPPELNITQVLGEDIQDWSIDRSRDEYPLLTVSLSRPKDEHYQLRIRGETALPSFPSQFNVPLCVPKDVIRANGFLTVGADSAIRLIVKQSSGLTQIDQAAFPMIKPQNTSEPARQLPPRCAFTYQFANMPFTLAMDADDVVTALGVDHQLIFSVVDNDAVFKASVELDIRDAPAREVVIETDPSWVVASVTGAEIADYDVRDADETRSVSVYFQNAVQGRILVELRLERSLDEGADVFSLPSFKTRGAKSERGYLVMSGEDGLRLKLEKISGLIEVHTGSTPMRVPDAQLAFRFKDADWRAEVGLERTRPVIYSEIFHLLALGDGAIYGSALVTYHISGAPTREFHMVIPPECQNVEFVGKDVRNWENTNNVWTVLLQDKIMGDYTLLAAYDRPVSYAGGEISIGGVQTEGTDSEVGYMVAASSAALKLDELSHDASIIRIDRDEVPDAYALLVQEPILATYKYVKKPHLCKIRTSRYETEPLINQVADHVSIRTSLSREGESVSTATYFVKNASGQYLALALPANANLWSTRMVEANGRRVETSALQGENGLLVPIPRPRDLNTPVQVELVYAQNHGRFSLFRRSVRLEAPEALRTPVPFTRYSVQLPESLSAVGASGNAEYDQDWRINGPGTVLLTVVAVYRTLAREATGALLLGLAGLAVACLVAWLTGRGRPAAFVFAAVAAIALLAALSSRSAVPAWSAFLSANGNLTFLSFTRSVGLPDDPPLFVDLKMAPAWLGSAGSFWILLAAGIAGCAALGLPFRRGGRPGPTAWAVSLTLLTLAMTQLAIARTILALVILALLPIIVASVLITASARRGCKRRQLRDYAEGKDLSPFQPEPPKPHARNRAQPQAPETIPTPAPAHNPGSAGYIRPHVLAAVGLAALGIAALAPFSMRSDEPSPAGQTNAPGLAIHSINAEFTVLDSEDNEPKKAQAVMNIDFTAYQAASIPTLPPYCVLTGFKSDVPRHVSMISSSNGYLLAVRRAGDYTATITFQAPVLEINGEWRVDLRLPPHLKNFVALRLPGNELDVQSDTAVYLKTVETTDSTEVSAMFEPNGCINFAWRPRMRKTALEKTAFFCEVNSMFVFEPGVINGIHEALYQVAQGEVKNLALSIPEPMNITSVSGPNIGAWRFDPASRNIEAILQKPVAGAFTLILTTQTPFDGLPYETAVGAPLVKDALRQRGSMAMAAPDTVQILVEPAEGLNAMNISDVPPSSSSRPDAKAQNPIRRAFRYNHLPASAAVKAEEVLPEIRVEEKAALSVANERIVLSTQLKTTVAKAGIFSLRLTVPEGFDVESLSGQDVSHWDDVKDKEREIVVHFNKPVLGTRELNLALTRMEKSLADAIMAPRVGVVNAFKHSGVLIVSGERGVRMTTAKREGVSEINPRDLGINQQGVLAFSLLRPQWLIVLKAEILTPVIKPEILQRVDLTEGMLKGKIYLRYRIENAGCKVFDIQAPLTNTQLTVSGRDIAKVLLADPEKGVWQVTLHNKVENTYALSVAYQIPFDPGAGEITLTPLLPLNTDTPRGYLTVMSDGRMQIKTMGELTGLKNEEARGIPADFGAGDLSDAILCFRTLQPDYVLPLSVVRHESAESLPARVDETLMTSTVSPDGKMLTLMKLKLNVGDMRFLKITLPRPEDRLWSAFVNGKAAPPALENAAYRIPLDEVEVGEPASVDLLFTGQASDRGLTRRLNGPRMDLPLTKILWTVYVSPNRFYYGFDGSLEYRDAGRVMRQADFDAQNYRLYTQRLIAEDLQKAKTVMALGEQYAREGKQKLAKQSLNSAITYSQGKLDLNEDARIQYQNLIQQQAVVGLADRRKAVRESQNIQLRQHEASAKENESLRALSGKILRQQEAAAGVAHAIHVAMPEHGRKLDFHRALQVEPNAEMSVEFHSVGGAGMRLMLVPVIALAILAICRIAISRRTKAHRLNAAN